jgi:D-amino-acid dehydrogenase
LNVGHGALGVTLALGSGKGVADRIAGRERKSAADEFLL